MHLCGHMPLMSLNNGYFFRLIPHKKATYKQALYDSGEISLLLIGKIRIMALPYFTEVLGGKYYVAQRQPKGSWYTVH